jgi:hypothetical protein
MLSRRTFLAAAPAYLALASAGEAAQSCSAVDAGGARTCVVGFSLDMPMASQRCDDWCWAACLEAIFTQHGHYVPQEAIVAALFGEETCNANGPGATPEQIMRVTQGRWYDAAGNLFRADIVSLPDIGYANFTGAGSRQVVQELAAGNPLINGALGHATVITAAKYIERSGLVSILGTGGYSARRASACADKADVERP